MSHSRPRPGRLTVARATDGTTYAWVRRWCPAGTTGQFLAPYGPDGALRAYNLHRITVTR